MRRHAAVDYTLAVVTVAAALLLQIGIRSLIGDRQPFVTFYLAVMISAWWGGLRPALVAVVLGFFAGVYFVTFAGGFVPHLEADEAILTIAYSVFAPLIAWFVHGMREAQQRALVAMREADASAAAARESEQKIRRLVDSNIIGVVFWHRDGSITDANHAFLKMSGYKPEALAGGYLRWSEIVAPEYLERHLLALEQMKERGECDAFDSALVRADSGRVPIVCGGVSFDPEVTRGVTFVVDTAEIWRVRRELEAEEARYRALFEDTPVILIEEDWSALKRRVRALQLEHDDLHAFFEANPDEVWECFRQIRIVGVNRAGRELLVMPTLADAPPDLAKTVTEDSRDRIAALLGAVARGRHQLKGEQAFFTMKGERREMIFEMTALPGHEESLDSVLLTLVDVTEEREIQADRDRLLSVAEQARAQAEAASRAKDQFLAMLGHELRNPFAAVRNAVTTARLDSTRRARALEIAERQCDQLGRLIDDLLDVARITQARINLRKERVSLAETLHRAVEATQEVVEDRGHRLETFLPAEEIFVEADRARLEQVVVNLLTNAAKYTEPGGRIYVNVAREGTDAVLHVRDTGVGIAPEALPHVFELFAQGERTLDRAQGGLGIGLTLVRRIIELHGGSVVAHSDGVGKGAEFEVRLPAFAVSSAQATLPSTEAARVPSADVIVIEDNADAAESLSMLLQVLGHRVRVFHDGPSALEAAAAQAPDVMLVDIGLPEMDGYEIARRARRLPALAHVKLVALTGYGLEEDKQRSTAAGFDYHLVKPVDLTTLQTLVPKLASELLAVRATVH